MLTIKNSVKKEQIIPIILVLLLFLFSSAIVLCALSLQNINTQLDKKIELVQRDIVIKGDGWNLQKYNADPQLLGIYPMYIFTTEGHVIDRRSPIVGFLDTSDYRTLLSFTTARTITTVSNQTRRVLSEPITDHNKIIGVITVSYYNPEKVLLSKIDEKLHRAASYISSKVTIRNGNINAKAVDASSIDYDVAYTIVDKYDTIIKKTSNVNNINKVPNLIDTSYVKPMISNVQTKVLEDNMTKEFFLVKTSPLFDTKKNRVGVIAVGATISPIFFLVGKYLLFEFLLGISSLLFYFFIYRNYFSPTKNTVSPMTIVFNEKTGALVINDQSIRIPYATNQFYLLKALFSKPGKRWETDEILEKFGEQLTRENWRIVYDTMIKINKKVQTVVPIKLILNQNKTYQLNPELLLPHGQH